MMDRRAFITVVGGNMLAVPLCLEAQPPSNVAKIGLLTPSSPAGSGHLVEAFRQGFRALGYIEGKTFVLEVRYGDGRSERLAELAWELVCWKPDVIVTSTDAATVAVRRQTTTMPIVMALSTDPVGTGFVASLARPGGNVTGNSAMSPELSAKRLELLREVVPGLSRIAMLWNPDIRGAVLDYRETEGAARSLRLQLQSVEVSRADDLERAFSAMTRGRAQALLVPAVSPVMYSNRNQVARLARQNPLPSMLKPQRLNPARANFPLRKPFHGLTAFHDAVNKR